MFKKQSSKICFKILLFVVTFVALERFCHTQTEGFRIRKILSTLPYDPKWETTPLTQDERKNVDEILSQPFHFLASGGQCYAFISDDGQVILKVFKHHHMRPKSWLNYFTWPWPFRNMQNKFVARWIERLNFNFSSCKIAYEDFKEETGLIYAHLNKTKDFNKKLIIHDKLNIAHELDVDTLEFALQKRADLVYVKINTLMKKGDIAKAKECIDSIFDLIIHRCKTGISDRDPVVKRNFGFLGEKAITIDLGSFAKDEYLKKPVLYKRQVIFETYRFKTWIARRHPQLSPYIEKKLKDLIMQEDLS